MVKGIQVIVKKKGELDHALKMIERSKSDAREGVDTVTGSSSSACNSEPTPEDVLYEMELKDMCEQDPYVG